MNPTVIVVQEIRTIWTKTARGGAQAVQRNIVPEVARIPLKRISDMSNLTLLHHRLIYGGIGRESFTSPTTEAVLEDAALLPYLVGCVKIGESSDPPQVCATFLYSLGYTGAPDRGWMRKTLFLPVGKWGQSIYNGRFSVSEVGWRYEKTVVNVYPSTDQRFCLHEG